MLNEELTNTNEMSSNTAIPSSPFLMSVPASQPKRYLNFLIDLLFQLIILYFFTFIYIIILHKIPQINFINFINYSILSFVIFILYYTLSEGLWGKSPAKFITYTRVKRQFSPIV